MEPIEASEENILSVRTLMYFLQYLGSQTQWDRHIRFSPLRDKPSSDLQSLPPGQKHGCLPSDECGCGVFILKDSAFKLTFLRLGLGHGQ